MGSKDEQLSWVANAEGIQKPFSIENDQKGAEKKKGRKLRPVLSLIQLNDPEGTPALAFRFFAHDHITLLMSARALMIEEAAMTHSDLLQLVAARHMG